MKLILIHGRAQELFEEAALKQTWIKTLKEGLSKSNLELPPGVRVEFPYYGKLLKTLTDEALAAPRQSKKPTRSGLGTVDEQEQVLFFNSFLYEMAQKAASTPEEKLMLKEIHDPKRGILNLELMQRLLIFLDKKQIMAETILRKVTTDVYMYLTKHHIKQQVNELVLNNFNQEPCVVVGHSLGSVVGYLVLKNNPGLNVKKYITVGSPLGSKTIRSYLEGPWEMPKCIKTGWFNAYDDRDYVALHPLDKIHFNIDPPIVNKNDVQNHTNNRHGIEGYLSDKEVARQIYQAIVV